MDGSFFSLSSCQTATTSALSECMSNPTFTPSYYSSLALYGTDMLKTYSQQTNFNMSGVVAGFVDALASLNATSAWLNMVPPYMAGNGATQTYVSLYNGVLFGAVRSPEEPCSTCIQNALNSTGDMAIVSRFANYIQTSITYDPTSMSELQNLLFSITSNFLMQTKYMMNLITFPTIYYGNSETGSSYLIKDCQRWTSDCPVNTTTRYMAWVANVAIFSNLTRQLFELDPNTYTLTFVGHSGDIYNISTRSWYQERVGWTSSFGACEYLGNRRDGGRGWRMEGVLVCYCSYLLVRVYSNPKIPRHAISTVESSSTIRSYSQPFSGSISGVASLSWYTGEAPQCLFSPEVNACHNASGAPAAAWAVANLYPTLPSLYNGFTSVKLACSMMYETVLSLNDVRKGL